MYAISPDERLMLCITNRQNANGDWNAQQNFLNLETKTFSSVKGINFLPNYVNGRNVQWIP
jgi:hypothetical protein